MPLAEALETTRIHRVAGLTGDRTALVTTADVGLIGCGQIPMPGEVSRAHHGVLCLDARPECRRHGLEVLRQPLEEGFIKSPPPGSHGSSPVGRAGDSGAILEDVSVAVIALSAGLDFTRRSAGGRHMRGWA